MKATSSKPYKKRKLFRLFFLHRYIGLVAALFAVFLSITGILLNHTEELGLHDRQINTTWLMKLYGIESPEIATAFSTSRQDHPNKEIWVAQLGDSLLLENLPLNCPPPLTGAIATDELLIISNHTQLCLFTFEAELIDNLLIKDQSEIQKLGLASNQIIVSTNKTNYVINTDFTDLIAQTDLNQIVNWQSPQPLPESISKNLMQQYKGAGLPLERIILDLHSGRVAGMAGVYFMDFMALLLIFLAITGVMMWSKRAANRKRKTR
ncbi:MAG: PepSY-associated TM helix domain-containing protein [Thiotrichaceae bacterium]